MILAIDIDGVCCDLTTTWLKHYNEEHGDSLTPEDVTHWEIERFVKCGKEIFKYLDKPDLYDDVEPLPWAAASVCYLRAQGHRVIFATSADVHHGGKKYDWLVKWGFLYPKGDRQDMRDYVEVRDKSLVRGTLLLDDYAGNLKNFDGIKVLFDSHHNKEVEGDYIRVADWPEFTDYIDWLDKGSPARGWKRNE